MTNKGSIAATKRQIPWNMEEANASSFRENRGSLDTLENLEARNAQRF